MNTRDSKTKGNVFILVTILMVTCGMQSVSYAQEGTPTITASVDVPLTEATLHGSVVTLTLTGHIFVDSELNIKNALRLVFFDNHGVAIHGVSVGASDVDRVSNTEVTVELTVDDELILPDYIDVARLAFFLDAQAIEDYDGRTLGVVVSVTPVEESLAATTEAPLTEATLDGSLATLTLSGCTFSRWNSTIRDALTVTGIEGVFVRDSWGVVQRVKNTVVTVELSFSGNIDEDATLALTVNAQAIDGYNQALTAEVPVAAVQESLVASTKEPLTEANLHGSIITLSLTGRKFAEYIGDSVSVTGIEGVTIDSRHIGLELVSDTEVTIRLTFVGNINQDTSLTLIVAPDAIVGGYDKSFTFEFPVTAVEESLALVASTEAPLTEATLHGSVVTLTLNGQRFVDEAWYIRNAVSISGIDGVTVSRYPGVERVNDTVTTLELDFNGNIDTDATLTLTVESDAIAEYNRNALTATLPVTAIDESLVASTEFPLTEANLDGSVITLTLTGRRFDSVFRNVQNSVSVTGIDGVTVEPWYVNNISDREVRVRLTFSGNMDTDATLTITVGADAIASYNQEFTAQFSVTAIQKSNAVVSISPASVQSPAVGEQFTLNLNIVGGENVAGYQATVLYDNTALNLVDAANGDYLPANPFFLADKYYGGEVRLNASTLTEAANGDGALATFTFEAVDFKASTVALSQVYLVDADGERWEVTTVSAKVTELPEPAEAIFGDINSDGVVNFQDLIIVNVRFGQRGQNSADLNGDGLVDIVDLVLVASEFNGEAAAPPLNPQALKLITAAEVQDWFSQARQLSLTNPAYLRGITVLEQLLKTLTPKKNALLPNYPNPFNPETWIPYHLSNDSHVQISIYDTKGVLVRRLDLGHQMAGYYADRTKAAYWDGKNESGGAAASGVYFCHLIAGKYSAKRKMLILK